MSAALAELRTTAVINTLRECQLFRGLPVADLRAIAALTDTLPLVKGEYLFHEGDPSAGFYVVQSGTISVHRVNALQQEQVIRIFRAGDSFAEATLASPKGCHANARALESTQVLLIRKDGMLDLLTRQPELVLRLLGSMGNHLRVLIGQLEDLALKDVETRLANWLLKRCLSPADDQPVRIVLTMTKRMLAGELGTISETLSRTFAKLREQQLVVVKGRNITVLSPVRLRRLLQRNLGEPT
ncbi:MAG TPA: Crp/Fnr family transcriptional regulator [Verrucomicrobiota bacterium]|nr:Crp/Fnr family transcriptional regulator [Verrucomicrobiota bacterium]HNT14837.1 Crp/Fnr family transcriptional regulator [Verrucomicrobiota bacterium]